MAVDERPPAAFTPGLPWGRGRDHVRRLIAEDRVSHVVPDGVLAQRILERVT